MFEKLKNAFKLNFEYVVDTKTFEEYLRQELKFSTENNLEVCVTIDLFYKGEKHSLSIWNFSASSIKSEQEKGLSVLFDENEFNSIDNLLNNCIISNTKLIDIKDYFVIKLLNLDSDFLCQYKANHPELKVEDYK